MSDSRARPRLGSTASDHILHRFSPDGRWVVYETDESGRPEIVAQAFPEPSGRWPVSTAGGAAPRWIADGTEIFFIAPDEKMMAVPVSSRRSTFEAGTPSVLFPTQIVNQTFKFQSTVSRNGRFLVNTVRADASTPPITVIVNATP